MNYVKGQSCTIEHGSYKILLKPLPLGKLKKVLGTMVQGLSEIGGLKTDDWKLMIEKVPSIAIERFQEVLPIIVDIRDNPFMKDEWVEENLTVPLVEQILEATYFINGVTDFLGRLKTGFGAPKADALLKDPGSASPGSTTSSGSPTDGPSEKPRI